MVGFSPDIEKLGSGKWLMDSLDPKDLNAFEIARVMAVHRDSFSVNKGEKDVTAQMSGRMMNCATSPIDYPAVGDWVLATFYDEQTLCIIHRILPRKSLLKRKTPGKKIDFQLIAANIDVAFIVQSLDANFNLRRLERYLVMVSESNIEPVALLSKSDLLSTEEIRDRIAQVHSAMPNLRVHSFSNKTQAGLDELTSFLRPRQTYCLLGSSGVGKTTLLNHLIGESVFKTRTVREKDSKGRHATTFRQLNMLKGGAMVIDTPGMRELGNFAVSEGIDKTFAEIAELALNCRFRDCRHVNEKGCAVLEAVAKGQLSEQRFQNFVKMNRESIHYEMSYYQKRMKDKEFGKMVKRVMKHKKNKR